jgi:hypothetical protein
VCSKVTQQDDRQGCIEAGQGQQGAGAPHESASQHVLAAQRRHEGDDEPGSTEVADSTSEPGVVALEQPHRDAEESSKQKVTEYAAAQDDHGRTVQAVVSWRMRSVTGIMATQHSETRGDVIVER